MPVYNRFSLCQYARPVRRGPSDGIFCILPFSTSLLRITGTPPQFISEETKFCSISLAATIRGFFDSVYMAIERIRGNTRKILALNKSTIILKLPLTTIFPRAVATNISMIAFAACIFQGLLFVYASVGCFRIVLL